MRYVLILFALLLIAAPALAAEPQSPRGIVMATECEQINPAETGFSCHFANGHINIQLHEKQSQMTEAKRKHAQYEFNKIALRYFELGGMTFPVHADFWPVNQYKSCGRSPRKPWFIFVCQGIGVTDN